MTQILIVILTPSAVIIAIQLMICNTTHIIYKSTLIMHKLLSEIQFLCSIHLDMHPVNTIVNTCLPGVGIFRAAPVSALTTGILNDGNNLAKDQG